MDEHSAAIAELRAQSFTSLRVDIEMGEWYLRHVKETADDSGVTLGGDDLVAGLTEWMWSEQSTWLREYVLRAPEEVLCPYLSHV